MLLVHMAAKRDPNPVPMERHRKSIRNARPVVGLVPVGIILGVLCISCLLGAFEREAAAGVASFEAWNNPPRVPQLEGSPKGSSVKTSLSCLGPSKFLLLCNDRCGYFRNEPKITKDYQQSQRIRTIVGV
jgi:hypothetical protein